MKLKQVPVQFSPFWQRFSFRCFAYTCFEALSPDMGKAASKTGGADSCFGPRRDQLALNEVSSPSFCFFFLLSNSSLQQTIYYYTF